MTDQPQADKQVESTAQPAPVPSADEKQVQEAPKEEAASPELQDSGEGTKASELPEGTKERTSEQFEKLKKQLATERTQRLQMEQSLRQTQTTPEQPEVAKQDWYDAESNSVDIGKLNNWASSLEQRASSAENLARGVVTQTQASQEKEAYESYPELDPNSPNWDENFHNAVSGYLLNTQLSGKQTSFKQAADLIKGVSGSKVEEAKKEGAKQALEELTPKEQASVNLPGRSDRRTATDTTLEDLQSRTRTGDETAIAERLGRMSPPATK